MVKDEKIPDYEYSKVPTQQIIAEKPEIPSHYGYGVRHVQLLICFFCIAINFLGRGHMGVTVVSMINLPKITVDTNLTNATDIENYTNITNVVHENVTTVDTYGHVIGNETIDVVGLVNSTDYYHRTFPWSKSIQEMILSAFFLGYCIMTVPMGLIVQRFGGKIPLQIALFVNGVVSILTPWLIDWGGWKAVCACRIAQGLSQAGVYPSIQSLLAKWVPINERGSLTSYVYTGSTLGTVVAFQLSGFLSESRWGWPSTFWTVGLICLALFAVLTIFGAASPVDHKTISEEEKAYIMGRVDDGKVKRLKTPWKAILTSRPVWGALITHIGSGITFVFFFTQIPSYIHYILGVNVRGSGLLSSLPYVVSVFTSLSYGVISDYLTNKKFVSVKNARRIFNSLSQVGIGVALICCTFTSSTAVAVTCLVIAMGLHVALHVGWMVNHIDLAPNFSGTLMMMGNVMLNFFNVLMPVLVSYVITDVYNEKQWRIMLFVVAGLALTTNAIFVLLISPEVQPWNDGFQRDKSIEETETKDEKEQEANKQLD